MSKAEDLAGLLDANGDVLATNLDNVSVAFADVTGKPTTISGYGITDAFDGAYGSLTGAPTAVSSFTNDAGYATTTYVDGEIADLVASAPATLDTLNELAAALGDDANFSTTVTNSIATKAPLASPTFTGTVTTGTVTVTGNISVDSGTIKLDGNYPVGSGNVALGDQALDDGSLSGGNNTAIGSSALTANTTGIQNTATGYNSAKTQTTANNSTAYGHRTLEDNTGDNNTALGSAAMQENTSGTNNTAVGFNVLLANTTGTNNTAVGYQAGNSNLGSHNTFLGDRAGYSFNTGGNTFNTFVGYVSGYNTTSGVNNTYVGQLSGFNMTTGSKNTIVGAYGGNQDGLDIRTASNRIVVSDGDGNIGMYIDNSQNAHFDGDVIAYSTTISDERLKDNIVGINNALAKVGQLNGYTFEYKADGKVSAGVIAQEVEAVLPEAVSEKQLPLKTDDDQEYKVVNYDALHGLLIEAIKELAERVEALEAK